jgi:hypothetical protein
MATNYTTLFNNHFFEFVEDIENVFPQNSDILVTKNTLMTIKKSNPKLLVKIWDKFVVEKYENEINAGDISFFINKDYSSDLSQVSHSDKIIESIDKLRGSIRAMSEENQQKSMQYIQNLCILAKMNRG